MKAKIFSNFKYISILTAAAVIASLLFSTAVMAEAQEGRLTVSGNGLLKVAPDIAYLNVGVRTSDIDAERASKSNIEITERIVESLQKSGIDKKDMKTQNYNIYPNYDFNRDGGESKIIGYEVTNSLNITIRNIDDVGKIIDECISAGSNMVNGLNYGVETPSIYYDQLFQRAISDAGKKASAISNSLGLKLSAPVSITEGGYVNAMPVYMNINADMTGGAMASKAAASTYAAPGEIDLSATVVVVYDYK